MNIQTLANKLKALQGKIPVKKGRWEGHDLADAFKWELFSEDEQERLMATLAAIQPRITWSKWGPQLFKLSVEDRDVLESWSALGRALDSEDLALAAQCRDYLLYSDRDKEAVYQAFMAIDETHFPEVDHCIQAPTVKWDGLTHYLYRRALRDAKEHMKQREGRGDYMRRWEIEKMRVWLSASQLERRPVN